MKKIIFLIGILYLITFLFFGCAKRKADDDVKLIKKLVEKLQYGMVEKNELVLDSLFNFSKEERAKAVAQLLADLNQFGQIESLALINKRFDILGDSAYLTMNLSGRQFLDSSYHEFKRPIEVFLRKSRQGWKITGYGLP
jgi:hypothetical protein